MAGKTFYAMFIVKLTEFKTPASLDIIEFLAKQDLERRIGDLQEVYPVQQTVLVGVADTMENLVDKVLTNPRDKMKSIL